MRLLVTGSRDFAFKSDEAAEAFVNRWVARYGFPEVVIHGDCRGADREISDAFQAIAVCGLEPYPVDHALDGPWPMAGPNRNRRMIAASKPTFALAVPLGESRGTWGCVRELHAAGVSCIVIGEGKL